MDYAVDIGTSSISVDVVKLGKVIHSFWRKNPQGGRDVISRIRFALRKKENLSFLSSQIRSTINSMLEGLKLKNGVSVGNVPMLHFFLGISPERLAFSPYSSSLRGNFSIPASQLGIKASGEIYIPPVIGHWIGSDAVAGILACELVGKKSMLIDIGTNTEIFASDGKNSYICSCASGPAFEGYKLSCGVPAIEGAIESYNGKWRTIGGKKPIGVCGSGMIDVITELLSSGKIDRKGRLPAKKFLICGKDESGTGKEIVLLQKDVREIQLAKAAIYAGAMILLEILELDEKDVELNIAGAFGNRLNVKNAKFIGMIPDARKVKLVGNSALRGARLLLSKKKRKVAEKVAKEIKIVDLASDSGFRKKWISSLDFPKI